MTLVKTRYTIVQLNQTIVNALQHFIVMEIILTSEQEKFINHQIKTGKYHSASEVIRDALQLLEEQYTITQIRLEKLKKEIAIGIEAAERDEVFDGEAVIKELFLELENEEEEATR
jgi:antitoxin ParD1/3/4